MDIVSVMISAFTNINQLGNDSGTIKKLMKVFEADDVVFGAIPVFSFDGNGQKVVNRPQVSCESQKYQVNFMPDRIDIVFSFAKRSNGDIDSKKETSVKIASKFLEGLISEFDFKISRFAYHTHYFYGGRENLKSDIFLTERHPEIQMNLRDWNARKVYKKEIELVGNDEILNIIEELAYLREGDLIIDGVPEKVTGLVIHYDINTGLFIKGERHKYSGYEKFMSAATEEEVAFYRSLKELL